MVMQWYDNGNAVDYLRKNPTADRLQLVGTDFPEPYKNILTQFVRFLMLLVDWLICILTSTRLSMPISRV